MMVMVTMKSVALRARWSAAVDNHLCLISCSNTATTSRRRVGRLRKPQRCQRVGPIRESPHARGSPLLPRTVQAPLHGGRRLVHDVHRCAEVREARFCPRSRPIHGGATPPAIHVSFHSVDPFRWYACRTWWPTHRKKHFVGRQGTTRRHLQRS